MKRNYPSKFPVPMDLVVTMKNYEEKGQDYPLGSFDGPKKETSRQFWICSLLVVLMLVR